MLLLLTFPGTNLQYERVIRMIIHKKIERTHGMILPSQVFMSFFNGDWPALVQAFEMAFKSQIKDGLSESPVLDRKRSLVGNMAPIQWTQPSFLLFIPFTNPHVNTCLCYYFYL